MMNADTENKWNNGEFYCRHLITGNDKNRHKQVCAKPYYNKGGMTLDEVGKVMGLTRERVRQLQEIAIMRFTIRAADVVASGTNLTGDQIREQVRGMLLELKLKRQAAQAGCGL